MSRSQEKEIYRNELAGRQLVIKNEGLPVVVILEGWSASGKGSVLGEVIKYMDPRFFRVYNMDVTSEDEKRHPFLYRHAIRMPMKGQFSFFDGGVMDEVTYEYLTGEISEKEYDRKVDSIIHYERQLRDNGYLVLKFFLKVSEKEQKERLDKLLDSKNTRWRVNKKDLWQNKNYKKCKKVYEDYIKKTDSKACPWHVIKADDRDQVELIVANTIISGIDAAIKNPWKAELCDNSYKMSKYKKLSDIKLKGKVLDDAEYKKKLKKLQKELSGLHNKLYRKKIPVIIAYEGWDAAGKGGNIKRVASALDPRGYEVFPIASPTSEEKNRHFLWRFYNRLPKTGHIAIFDRTWYGRVMVERLEGFCSENDWKRAYNEINEFEKDLTDWGAIVIKFWVQIDKDTQLERFTLRQNTPEKQWKITDEDWRNREKWDLYEKAVDEMIKKTGTGFAPWHVLESNDKKYARIKALEIIISEIKKRL
ncbi:MAG: polyphosphate:AMP phosphotransferase [Lachnospiraceae bacterium]|nr:polyphosphate:AMP phosphotransferase [Lachnospiraceae bacterium]